MGYIEDIQAMDLSDEVKNQLITAHRSEIDPLRDSNRSLVAQSRRDKVEAEIEALKGLGFGDAPSLLKYTRRIFLSADAEEPGAVLLSDNEMGLAGDSATGSTGREEISVAGALREFISLMPKNGEGKLAIALSDQADGGGNHGRPEDGDHDDPEQLAAERAERTARLAGRKIDRESVRGKRYGTAAYSGGGE